MKKYMRILIVFLCTFAFKGYSQNCADDYSDITTNQYVCGNYGDANGNTNWNWEIKPSPNGTDNTIFCKHWSARTSNISTKLTIMGSPFVNSPTTTLDLISQSEDYTKAKGWELLQRDFGCTHVTAYPYFVLYNKYTGLIRVYIYKTETPEGFTSMLVTMEPTMPAPYPATTSLGDELAGSPAAFLNANQSGKYGKSVVAVTEQGGYTRWNVAEFNPGFDPNIQNGVYSGAGLKFTIYGVVTNDLKAVIKGRSVTGTDQAIYSFSYVPKTAPASSNNGQTVDFSAIGEKFSKFSKSLTEVRNIAKTFAERVKTKVHEMNHSEDSPEGKIEIEATKVSNNSNNDVDFLKMLGEATTGLATGAGSVGTVLKFVGELIGLFSTGSSSKPASMPTYTSYDMELKGTLTAKTVQQSFICRVPGTIQVNNDNATYYKCPLGIFNIKNTPEADTVLFTRVHEYTRTSCCLGTVKSDYISYRMRNNLAVSYNRGAGLDLVSVQAAIVGQILPTSSDANATASYDLFAPNIQEEPNSYDRHYVFNFMRPDIESGRLLVTNFDTEKKLHTIQTPYVNIECLNGLAFNARKETKVWLRIKAVLKKQNDPDNTPILYIHDYEINVFQGSFDSYLRSQHLTIQSWGTALPYSNYTEYPTYHSDEIITGIVYNQTTERKADNSLTTQEGVDVIVPSGQTVTYKSGSIIDLRDGFDAQQGSEFEAAINTYGYNITCGSIIPPEEFQASNCYNNTISGLRAATGTSNTITETTTPELLKVYPIPTTGKLFIEGVKANSKTTITILDQSGRSVKELRPASFDGGRIDMDVSSLSNGVYFVKIQTHEQIITRKIVVSK
jgi:type IX secretion system substrate protein